ncbi:hypothetical protein [Propionivibrio sp.]|uniref:hypothetical protein n=1 Tax=Propionivibrio sp. TaxID=2212460 RepID=UPI003BF01B0C
MFTNSDGQEPGLDTPARFSNSTSKPHPYRVRPHQPAASNATANLVAQLEKDDHRVVRDTGGGFTVCKYGLSRYCKNPAELTAFAVKVGVRL